MPRIQKKYIENKKQRINSKNKRKYTLISKCHDFQTVTGCSVFLKIVDNECKKTKVFASDDLYYEYTSNGLHPSVFERRCHPNRDTALVQVLPFNGEVPPKPSPVKLKKKKISMNAILPGHLKSLPVFFDSADSNKITTIVPVTISAVETTTTPETCEPEATTSTAETTTTPETCEPEATTSTAETTTTQETCEPDATTSTAETTTTPETCEPDATTSTAETTTTPETCEPDATTSTAETTTTPETCEPDATTSTDETSLPESEMSSILHALSADTDEQEVLSVIDVVKADLPNLSPSALQHTQDDGASNTKLQPQDTLKQRESTTQNKNCASKTSMPSAKCNTQNPGPSTPLKSKRVPKPKLTKTLDNVFNAMELLDDLPLTLATDENREPCSDDDSTAKCIYCDTEYSSDKTRRMWIGFDGECRAWMHKTCIPKHQRPRVLSKTEKWLCPDCSEH